MTDWTTLISAGLGPIIVISACGLLCLAFYNRLATVVTRLRAFHREQVNEQEALARLRRASREPDPIGVVRHQEVLGMLEVQVRRITRRARWIRRVLGCLLMTILCLALCSLLLGAGAVWQDKPVLSILAATMFVSGMAILVTGIVFALVELRQALDPIDLEARFIADLPDRFENDGHGA